MNINNWPNNVHNVLLRVQIIIIIELSSLKNTKICRFYGMPRPPFNSRLVYCQCAESYILAILRKQWLHIILGLLKDDYIKVLASIGSALAFTNFSGKTIFVTRSWLYIFNCEHAAGKGTGWYIWLQRSASSGDIVFTGSKGVSLQQ